MIDAKERNHKQTTKETNCSIMIEKKKDRLTGDEENLGGNLYIKKTFAM